MCLCTFCEEGFNATRTGCGEDGVELDIFGVVFAVPSADAEISARGEASSTRTEHSKQVTHSPRMIFISCIPYPELTVCGTLD